MERKTHGEIEYLTYNLFKDLPLLHGVFLRKGGVSTGDFSSLNCGMTQGDCKENVLINRNRALQALGLTHMQLCYNVHGKNLAEIHTYSSETILEVDGLYTQKKGLALSIFHADCQSAIFYDPKHHVVANVHAGWRGSVLNIYRETVQRLKEQFSSKPEDLLVGISPSLGPTAFQFLDYQKLLPIEFWDFQIKPFYFDFWQISRAQLLSCGLLNEHIEIAEICTYSNPEEWFSYRRVKKSGRHVTLASLL